MDLDWYGLRCPDFLDLEEIASSMDVPVLFHTDFDVPRFFWDDYGDPWFIGIPEQFGVLARMWALAHEVGHMLSHEGPPRDRAQHLSQEDEANRWASCALIPYSKIEEYGEPTVHGLVGYLRKHYQRFGGKEDRVRALAYRIAYTRLKALGEGVA